VSDAGADAAGADTTASSGDGSAWGAGGLTLGGSLADAVEQPPTVYAAVGGQRFFDDLVDRFYDAVESDELLRPMYPADLVPSRHRLAGFLAIKLGVIAGLNRQRAGLGDEFDHANVLGGIGGFEVGRGVKVDHPGHEEKQRQKPLQGQLFPGDALLQLVTSCTHERRLSF